MKAICICASNRPDMIRRCLESLSKNNLDGWHLFISCDMDCVDVFKEILEFKDAPVTWWRNPAKLGPDLNTFTVCSTAMEGFDAEALVYFDDDMELSPDAIDMCNWYLNQPHAKDPDNNGGMCLCTDSSDPSRPQSISPNDTWRGLVGQGYCYTRSQYFNFVKRVFWIHEPHFGGDGYDWSIGHKAQDLKKRILRPRLSRSRHMVSMGHHGLGKEFPKYISEFPNTNFTLENE